MIHPCLPFRVAVDACARPVRGTAESLTGSPAAAVAVLAGTLLLADSAGGNEGGNAGLFMFVTSGRCCDSCMRIGCPAISIVDGKAKIDNTLCVGCGVCQQLCKFDALETGKEA